MCSEPLASTDSTLSGVTPCHVKAVRNDPHALAQLVELGNQLHIQRRQKVKRDHVGFFQVQLEDVGMDDLDHLFDFVLFDVLFGFGDSLGVDVESLAFAPSLAAVTTIRPSPQPRS